jgi:G3E family GTPase
MIITGFLGSGKTTFINNLLYVNKDIKIGLIENEFGEVSIDSRLITDYRPENILELNNGCICCSIFNEFSLGLQEFIKKNNHLEQIIIETTGVADPGPIIESFFQDENLKQTFEFSGTICIVDALNFLDNIDGYEQKRQILLSDLIVLNKVNEAYVSVIAEIKKRIAAINKMAQIVETNYSHIEDAHLYILQPQLQDDFVKKLRRPFYSEPDSTDFHSFTIRFGGFINEAHFRDWFTYFASVHRKDIFRIKGILNFENNPVLGIVQSVGGMTSITEGSVVNPYEPLENVLVFIGKEISKYEVEKMFREYLMQVN